MAAPSSLQPATATGEPHVSVLMAALNHERFAADAVRSVLDQDYEPLELIAIDDASDDSTAEVLEQCAAEAPPGRMRVVRHERREGIAETRAHAVRLAHGELIGLLDSDDLWLPGKLGPQAALLRDEADVGLVHGEYEAFDSDTGETIPWGSRNWDRDGDQLLELVRQTFIMCGSVLVRRSAIDRRGVGFVETGYPGYDDYLLWLTIALDWRVAHQDRKVMRYRRHAGNLSQILVDSANPARARAGILELFATKFPEAEERAGAELRRMIARHLISAAARERSRSNMRALQWTLSAFRQDPATALDAFTQTVGERLTGSAIVGRRYE
jgi:glycosyltransferase involved in cell wall biosynthesis